MPDAERGIEPEIAAVVLVENGGHGGTTCAPIAQTLFTAYAQKAHPEMLAGGKSEVTGSGEGVEADALALPPEAGEVIHEEDSNQSRDTAIAAPTIVRRAGPSDVTFEAPAMPAPSGGVNPLQGVMKGPDDAAPPPAASPRRPRRPG
jgi:hypothetical protein